MLQGEKKTNIRTSVILTLLLSAVNSACIPIIVNEQQHNQELFFFIILKD